ncbi:NADP-dependent isocitrate dehydrogenase, partial [Streptomyces albidoflavus]
MLQTWSGAPVTDSTIIYTHTDEAPALATYSFLPVVGGGAPPPGGGGGRRGTPRGGRIIASLPQPLPAGPRHEDAPA